jgi:hypothetical protein
LATTEQVRANNEVLVRVYRPAWANDVVPPAAPLWVTVVAGSVRVTRQRVADDDNVVALRRESPVGLKGNVNWREFAPGRKNERVALSEEDGPLRFYLAEA